MSEEDQNGNAQKIKKIAAASYDYENDPRWADYWSNILIPPHMASRADVVDHFKRKFYQRYIENEEHPFLSDNKTQTPSFSVEQEVEERESGDKMTTDDIEPENACHYRPITGKGRPFVQRQQSFRRDFEHAAAETYLITGLSFKLLKYLGVGYRWMTRLLALLCYAMLLLPGFLQVAYYYYFSRHVHRSIVYGDRPRNRLDLYLPENSDGKKPVVIFVTGGAWIIGYKAWGSLLGLQLAERDIIVACIDYRNFPQGTVSDMVKDVSQGISFVCNNAMAFGGDPERVYLIGQSAGAHLSTCALLGQAIRESQGESSSWSVSQIKAYFSLSGGYNLVNLVEHFHNRGLYRAIFMSIMEGEDSLKKHSPELLVQDKSISKAVSLLPPFYLFHGSNDKSIPSVASENFAHALENAGGRAELIIYRGKGHTDMFVQDPLRGGKDELFEHMVSVIHAGDEEALAKDAMAPPMRRFVPEILLKLAGQISPF